MDTRGSIRRCGAAAGMALALLAAGCGGDNPQMGSSNRGANAYTEDTTVENVFIVPRFIPGSCAIQVGSAAALTFTVTNNRSTEPERLLAIDSEAADAIRLSPGQTLEIPPRASIAAGQPVEDVGPAAGADRPVSVSVEGLSESAKPGTHVDVTFRFDKRGDLTMQVPIEACPTQK